MKTETSLVDKRALVTGASSGIGRAIACELGGRGCRVALLARRADRLHETAALLEPGTATVHPVDLADVGKTQKVVAEAAAALGGLDIVVNAAGVGRQAKLIDGPVEDWKDMLDINVMALAVVTREALPFFPAAGGHVVNIGSLSGHRVPGRGGFYAATKFAVRAMTEGLRQELRERNDLTRVSSISPGFVDTDLLDEYFSGGDQSKQDAIGYPILKPEEVAELVIRQLTMPPTAEVTDILVRPTGQKT
ncbi:MAG: SDR family NAD(P)-dependent oxidoreductase [Verrucomicrobiales bacterium]